MEMLREQLRIPATRDELAGLRDQVRRFCGARDVRPNATRRAVLGVDEVSANAMEHAGITEGTFLDVSLELEDSALIAQIKYEGVEFDPSSATPLDTSASMRRKRGFGLYLVQLVADEVSYLRTPDGRNVVSIKILDATCAP